MTCTFYHALTRTPAAAGDPLVFAFHGTGGDEHQFSDLVEQILPKAGLVAPRGDVSEHGALRFFRRTGEGVYDMTDLAERTERMAAFVAGYKAAHPGSPVYGMGYSNGANILAAVAFKHPDLFDRMALLHPLIPWQPEANAGLAGKQVLITGGRRDPICPLPLTERLVAYFGAQGSEVETSFHDGGHEIRQPELAALAAFLSAPQSR
ncbi:alpha/beta hydrolase [Hoeflea ulvae]|uniref:Alpha/beta hydrolase n=1 Tax=Hoeflea ulvae TaxID=2983764 RepID=A0ABT3YC47_9HYPH|nr:alpha/beta hydrolase [Hoeflea ulvae]MCY0093461.1 alpha/beta hydrolase [Hoeflea ulvae]